MPERTATGTVLLTESELAAWRGFLRVHAALARDLDAELVAAHGLPLSSYEVLLTVADAPAERMRMSEIADSVLLSRSGVTRLVDRLERDGLVERIPCEDDARGQYAVLTAAGRKAFDAARATHLAGVRRRFLEQFDAEELRGMAGYWERLVPGTTR
jgi:DNA-binding MarR family transcriptional regulator